VKVWMVPLLIDAAAEPGERTVVAVTPQGRSAEMKFKVVTHAPDIADLRIVEARPDGTEFTVLAKGIGADFGGDKGSLLASFECGGGFSVSRCTVSKVVAKGSAIRGSREHPAFRPGKCARDLQVRCDPLRQGRNQQQPAHGHGGVQVVAARPVRVRPGTAPRPSAGPSPGR
jgi:hypothetical protein